jgi:hypothetical protein
LAADLTVDGFVDWQKLPPASQTARTDDGYEVHLDDANTAGRESALSNCQYLWIKIFRRLPRWWCRRVGRRVVR